MPSPYDGRTIKTLADQGLLLHDLVVHNAQRNNFDSGTICALCYARNRRSQRACATTTCTQFDKPLNEIYPLFPLITHMRACAFCTTPLQLPPCPDDGCNYAGLYDVILNVPTRQLTQEERQREYTSHYDSNSENGSEQQVDMEVQESL